MNQQPVNLQDRRQERAVQQVRVYLVTEVMIAGKWIATKHELPGMPTAPSQPNVAPSPAAQPQEKRQAPPMTMGRDPAKHLMTIGKKFKGMTIEQADAEHGQHELYGYWEWIKGLEDPGATLEVTGAMIEAYLLERQYDPKTRPEKYKTPRREPKGGPGRDW